MTTEVSEGDTEAKQNAAGAEPNAAHDKQKPSEVTSTTAATATAAPGGSQEDTPPPPPSPEEEAGLGGLKPRQRLSAGKGLSRLFSNFLKRRSTCSSDGEEGELLRSAGGASAAPGGEEETVQEEEDKEQEEVKVDQVDDKEVKGNEEKTENEVKGSEEKTENEVKGSEEKTENKVKGSEEKTENEVKGSEESTKEQEEVKVEKKSGKKKKKEAKKKAEEKKKEEQPEEKKKTSEEGKEGGAAQEEEEEEEEEEEKGEEKPDKKETKRREKEERAKKKREEEKEKKKQEEEKKRKKDKNRKKTKKEEEEVIHAPVAAPEEPEVKLEAAALQDQGEEPAERGGAKEEEKAQETQEVTSEEETKETKKETKKEVKKEVKKETKKEKEKETKKESKKESKKEVKKEEKREVKKEEKREEKREEKKEKEEETKEDNKTEDNKLSRRPKTMQCQVVLLDDTHFDCELDKHAKAQELLSIVCDHLNLMEKDYFALAHWESPTSKTWIDPSKELRKQVPGPAHLPGSSHQFTFNVKFYPPDPAQLTEDLTRYLLCLQLRKDILSGVLPCSFVTLSLLGSYTVQSEVGEYDPELHPEDYVSSLSLAPGQSKELEGKVMELHRTYRSMSPAQADMSFLENAKKLSMYGVDLHQAKDLDGVDITLGVCSSGLMVYKDKLRINRFPWPKVLKISYKRSSFFIKIRASEQEQYESTIGFKLPNYRAAKKLWKVSVEHHTFFRVSSVEPPPRRFIPQVLGSGLGSKFRYSGRTQAQTRQASSLIARPAPRFTRSASKRLSRCLDGVEGASAPRVSARPVSAPVFSHAALLEAGIPMATPTEGAGPQTSTPIKKLLEVTVETVEPKTDVKDFDKPPEEALRHHASISELKRNFMASGSEPRPSEWDKRLSSHSPFRGTLNGQDGVDITTETDGGGATSVTTTTTHISKVVKTGSSESRVEKRIVITADSDADQDQGTDGASAM